MISTSMGTSMDTLMGLKGLIHELPISQLLKLDRGDNANIINQSP